ncbi:leucine-rich repeat-containing protein 55 isoform X1 [Octodon degus]|uniref:Leucine-rich repeat-containing protein 55 isoform X1 n=1 Tax=Octodon degus TaxID=10160 RepID=A0A6P6DPE4_OCTDE|nr:leucine-rich repeat-containing protein 55 isoform X1 [Octodon degus]XP_023561832.1 leucine-rich repeat-containing protein 55 isoform X1 [Octodon degus]
MPLPPQALTWLPAHCLMGPLQSCRCQLPKMGDTWAQLPWPGPCHPALLLLSLLLAAGVMPTGGGASCPVLCTCRNQVVDCSSQRLFSVPPDLPMDTRNLSLAHNRISTVPPGYLTCYMELHVLDLRNNSLVELPPGLFLHAKRLAHLDLSYNNLSHVPADMFQAAHGLVRIDLSHNPWLRRVHPQAFQGLVRLQDLDLSYGGLAFLSLEALEGLPGLVTLQIGGNPWVCGCAMEPLLKWLRNRIQRCTAGKGGGWGRGCGSTGVAREGVAGGLEQPPGVQCVLPGTCYIHAVHVQPWSPTHCVKPLSPSHCGIRDPARQAHSKQGRGARETLLVSFHQGLRAWHAFSHPGRVATVRFSR